MGCSHCGNEITSDVIIKEGNHDFCCHGCRIVFNNIHESGLEDFYKFRDKNLTPVGDEFKESAWSYLNDNTFRKEKFEQFGGLEVVRFFIEGAHCQACLWVLELLPEKFSYVKSSRFSLDKSILELHVEPGSDIAQVAQKINFYGYRPHLVLEDKVAKDLKNKEKKKALIRLGVSFFSAGNIMLLTVSSYAGLDGELKQWFDYICMFLSLPAVTFCSLPFYRATFASIRNNNYSIDISIAIGIIFGFLASSLNTIRGSGDVYFDTVTMLVFLLLGSRLLLDSVRDRGMAAGEAKSFLDNLSTKKILPNGDVVETHSSQIRPGDKLLIEAGQVSPVDGILESKTSFFNESVITGESLPVRKSKGDSIFGGSNNQGGEVEIIATQSVIESKMGKILSRLQENWGRQTHMARLADKFSKKLVIVATSMAAMVLMYFAVNGDAEEGLSRALAIIVITCPCALGFNIPIAMLLGMKKLAKAGIILKSDIVVEKVNRIKNIFFDKTGTVTDGEHEIIFTWLGIPRPEILYSLELNSPHPLAKKVCAQMLREYQGIDSLKVEEFVDIIGKGPSGKIKNIQYQILPNRQGNASFDLYEDGKQIMSASVLDSYHADFPEAVKELMRKAKFIYLLSGDSKFRTEKAATACAGDIQDYFFEQDPEGKEQIISNSPHSMMIGDGVNDALALKAAEVGVAVSGEVDLANATADVSLLRKGPKLVVRLIKGCEQMAKTIKANIALALVYNVVFISMALFGKISPLAAAILMPASSITLLVVSLIMISRMDRELSI